MPEDLGEGQRFPEPDPLPPDRWGQLFDLWAPRSSRAVPWTATVSIPGSLFSPLCPENYGLDPRGLQNHPHFCFIHSATHFFILYSFNVYWAPISAIWKSCLHLLWGRGIYLHQPFWTISFISQEWFSTWKYMLLWPFSESCILSS